MLSVQMYRDEYVRASIIGVWICCDDGLMTCGATLTENNSSNSNPLILSCCYDFHYKYNRSGFLLREIFRIDFVLLFYGHLIYGDETVLHLSSR